MELEVASNGCLDAGLFELALVALGAGVAEAPLESPMVIRMNSLKIPSSLYDSCIGLAGCEYKALTIVFEMPWVLAVRKFGAKAALGTAFLLVSNVGELVNHFYSACDSISNLCVEQLD